MAKGCGRVLGIFVGPVSRSDAAQLAWHLATVAAYMFEYVCLSMYVYVYAYMYVYMYEYVCLSMYVYVYVYVHVYLYVYVYKY